MPAPALDATVATETATSRALKPGIYHAGSPAEFGLWRLCPNGVWLFCMPVAGATWRRAFDQNPGDKLIMLVDETRI